MYSPAYYLQANVPLLHLVHLSTGADWLHGDVFPHQRHLHFRRPHPHAVSDHRAALPLPALNLGIDLAGFDLSPGE